MVGAAANAICFKITLYIDIYYVYDNYVFKVDVFWITIINLKKIKKILQKQPSTTFFPARAIFIINYKTNVDAISIIKLSFMLSLLLNFFVLILNHNTINPIVLPVRNIKKKYNAGISYFGSVFNILEIFTLFCNLIVCAFVPFINKLRILSWQNLIF